MYAFLFRLFGDEELVRERMCCAIASSLSFTHSLKTYRSSPYLEKGNTHTHTHIKHENTKLTFEQKIKQRHKMASCFIHPGKQQKKEKQTNIVQTGILLTQTQQSHSCHSHIHTHSQKYSLLELTSFFCCFCHSFFRQVQIFKFFFFRIHFSISILFI